LVAATHRRIFLRSCPWNRGRRYPPWFFLLPSYWGLAKHRASSSPPVKCHSKVPDVLEEERLTFDDSNRTALLIAADAFRFVGIRKSYGRLGLPARAARSLHLRVKTVVHSLSFTAHEGELFVLLGHNGAGKTTAMNVMMGEVNWENGDIFYRNCNMRDDLASFQEMLGVCPQHDILFQDLTPDEHIDLFGGLKLMPRDAIRAAKEELMSRFLLTRVRNKPAGKFSGGMKRRLSCMIAILGNPKIIILDEPTTGMDPVNRRAVWEVFGLVKQGFSSLSERLQPPAASMGGAAAGDPDAAASGGNIVFLTTHSMEEAEVLGDKIAIMKAGYLQYGWLTVGQ
jgi:ABC-type multidrug transport system ATPase subunit